MKLTRLFNDFFHSEKSGGIILILCTIVSLVLANSGFSENYLSFWNLEANGHTMTHWINDGLMTIFFLLIGLELEREVYIGELSDLKSALMPMLAAVGELRGTFGYYWRAHNLKLQADVGQLNYGAGFGNLSARARAGLPALGNRLVTGQDLSDTEFRLQLQLAF